MEEPERAALSASRCEINQQMELEIEPERVALSAVEREMNQQMQREVEPLSAFQREISCDFWCQCWTLRLVCKQITCYAHRAVKKGYVDEQTREEMEARVVKRDEFLKNLVPETFQELVEGMKMDQLPTDPIPEAFNEIVAGKAACTWDDGIHKAKVEALLVDDPKHKCIVPSRFCSFHLDGFDLDDISNASLGPQYQPGAHRNLATSSTDVVSIRDIKAAPGYPVELYGKVIARDEVDFKCVYLFDRERKDAQTITSEKDMLALTGPNRALVTLGYMYFEFDLKMKGKDGPDDEVQFSKGVIQHFYEADDKRIVWQLPSFESTVKLVLQNVHLPLAAILEVSVVRQGPSDPLVHFDGKLTAGTTRNYRQHTLLYDSSIVRDGFLMRGDGSLVLNRDLVAVNRYARDQEDEKLVLYVCFLDAGSETEDADWAYPEDEDDDDDDEVEEPEEQVEDEVEEDRKNFVTLKYPLGETVWEHRGLKLRVKVKWTAVHDKPEYTDFFYRRCRLPGSKPNYRLGIPHS
ncbi:unnamed protein product [Alopecurus aequalis]